MGYIVRGAVLSFTRPPSLCCCSFLFYVCIYILFYFYFILFLCKFPVFQFFGFRVYVSRSAFPLPLSSLFFYPFGRSFVRCSSRSFLTVCTGAPLQKLPTAGDDGALPQYGFFIATLLPHLKTFFSRFARTTLMYKPLV